MPGEREHGGVSREGRLEMRVFDQSRADHPKQVIDLAQSDNQQLFEGMNGGALPVAPRGFPCSCWGRGKGGGGAPLEEGRRPPPVQTDS